VETACPAPALTQFSGAIEQRDFARHETKPLLTGSGQIAGNLQKGHHLYIARDEPQRFDLLDVDRAAREQVGQRFSRRLHLAVGTLLGHKEPEAVREENSNRQDQEPDLDQHHDVEKILVYHY
jgi:hypothetical protein